MNSKRIGIIGCAGTGKSLLAERIASQINVDFLASKDITGDILRRDGFDYASGMQIEKFLATPKRQKEILRETKKQQSGDNFITDRTAVDLAAYAVLESDRAYVDKYMEEYRELSKVYTHLFFCPWFRSRLDDNNKRTLDQWYQFAVHAVEMEVLNFFDLDAHVFDEDSIDERVQKAVDIVESEDTD